MATTDVGSETASAVDVSWATPTSTSHVVPPDSEFGKRMVKEFVPMIKGTFRSPAFYLRVKLDSPEKQQVFAYALMQMLPERDDLFYQHQRDIPHVTACEIGSATPLVVHIAAGGFMVVCSMRPFPSIEVFCQLVENIMADGLETSSEPLLVIQPDELVDNNVEMSWPGLPAHEAPLKGFSIGYTKGMARMCTALSLFHWIGEMALIAKKVTLSSMRVSVPYISITRSRPPRWTRPLII